MTYEIRYGTLDRPKTLETCDYSQANRIFDKIQKSMTNHNLKGTVALWENAGRGGVRLVRVFRLK